MICFVYFLFNLGKAPGTHTIDYRYNKTEDLTVDELKRFDYLLLGSQLEVRKTAASNFSNTHHEYFAVRAFDRLRYISHLPLALRTYERIFPEWIRSHILFPSLEFRVKVIVLKKKNT
jgi:hypothetical protein